MSLDGGQIRESSKLKKMQTNQELFKKELSPLNKDANWGKRRTLISILQSF